MLSGMDSPPECGLSVCKESGSNFKSISASDFESDCISTSCAVVSLPITLDGGFVLGCKAACCVSVLGFLGRNPCEDAESLESRLLILSQMMAGDGQEMVV